jgi:hypothetical protein
MIDGICFCMELFKLEENRLFNTVLVMFPMVIDETGTVYRPVTGRPARVLTLKFCFFHVKIYKTSVGSQDYLPDNI